jgi:hypothetical protein
MCCGKCGITTELDTPGAKESQSEAARVAMKRPSRKLTVECYAAASSLRGRSPRGYCPLWTHKPFPRRGIP